ncbi:hypothetical protein [Flexithrix dorotheae]|uniref:hypothetical protein n=1 Tax=Flexithrix dorotheae TaxID=70993 RepID=UPI0012FABF3B|nr:hypothetical protein [Flexithrix dorotheae]
MGILATCFIGISLLICWMIDKGYMNVEISSDKIKLKGYFSIQKIEYTHSEIEGYQLNEVVDQFHSLHQQIRLKTNAGKIIVFPKVAYENYPFLIESITNKYKFMNLEPLRFANFYKKTLPLIAALSGLLYLLKILFNLIE